MTRLTQFLRIVLLPALTLGLSLVASLGTALVAPPDATRVAVPVLPGLPGGWAAIEGSGLPVARVLLGGMLVVVEGAGAPRALARLRGAVPFVLDSDAVPGCEPQAPRTEGSDDDDLDA